MLHRRLQLGIVLLVLTAPAGLCAAPPRVRATLYADLGSRPSLRARTVKAALVQAVRAEGALAFQPLESLLEPGRHDRPVPRADAPDAPDAPDASGASDAPSDAVDARIEATPAGAEVRIDGTFVGFSPLTARGLGPGRHRVTVSSVGFRTRTLPLPPGAAAGLKVKLDPLPGRPAGLLRAALEEAAAAAAPRRPRAQAAARRLGLDLLLLATLRPRGGLISVKLFAYDARSGRAVSKATISVTAEDPERGCRELVDSVVPFLRARPPGPAPRSWFSRARERAYFWPAVGAGAAIIGVAVGLGVYLGTRDEGPGPGRRLVALPAVSRW